MTPGTPRTTSRRPTDDVTAMTYPEKQQNGNARVDVTGDVTAGGDVTSVMSFETMTSGVTTMTDATSHHVAIGGDLPPKRPPPDPDQSSCKTGFCRNMTFFAVVMAAIFLVRGALLQYSEDILIHIGRRYPITAKELDFVIGCERIGFVAALLFAAYFGNRMHKPVTISIGGFICALGAILMAVPFFVSGPRLFEGRISQFAVAGLCKQTQKNVSYQTQCDLIAFKGDDGTFTFTMICMAKLLVGIGGALYASLGLVYIEEGSPQKRLPLYIGLVVCMHGFGRFVGNLLAAWFTSLPEASNTLGSSRLLQDYAVYDQERVGRWWLGYPVFSSLLLCLSLMTLWFPHYITVPDWVLRRRAKRARLEAELERRRRLKVLASKKRHSSDPNGHKKSKPHRGRHRKVGDNKGVGENKGDLQKGTRRSQRSSGHEDGGVVNEMDVTADEVVRGEGEGGWGGAEGGSNDVTTRDPETGVNDLNKDDADGHSADVTIHVPNDLPGDDLPDDLQGKDPGDSTSLEVNMDSVHLEERDKEFTEEELEDKKIRKKVRRRSNPDRIEEQDGAEGKRKSREEGGQPRSKRSSRTGQPGGEAARKHKYRSSGTPTAARHVPRRIRIRKENIRDLPQTIWKLLNNLRLLIVMLGAILAGFFFNGYLASLPEYMYVQFQRSWETSLILAGVTGPLAWGIGTLIGGILMYRFRSLPLSRVTLVMVGCILVCGCLTLLNMVFHCQHDTSPNSTAVASCAERCECDSYKVQYEPLCGSDGKTYPSPCHAGCTNIEKTDTAGLFKFTGCACVGGSGTALQGACEPYCSQLVGFVIITFFAVLLLSTGIVPVFVVLFRSVRSRSKSFTVGFAIWSVYTFSQTLGPVVFRYALSGRCRQWSQDCLEEDVCWGYDLQPYRLVVNGLAAALLFAAAVPFLLVFWHLKRSKARKMKQEGQNNNAMQLEPTDTPGPTPGPGPGSTPTASPPPDNPGGAQDAPYDPTPKGVEEERGLSTVTVTSPL